MAEELNKPKRRWRGHDLKSRRGRVEIGSVLREVIDRRVPTELQRLTRLRNLWIEELPISFADHVWPMLVQGTRLLVHVHDSQWLHEMTYWRQEVLECIAQVWPEAGIETIEAYVGPLPPLSERRPGPPPTPAPVDRSPVLDPEVPDETMTALNDIRDERLREALAQARAVLGKPR